MYCKLWNYSILIQEFFLFVCFTMLVMVSVVFQLFRLQTTFRVDVYLIWKTKLL